MQWQNTDLQHIVLHIIQQDPKTKADFNDARRKKCSELRIAQPPNRLLLRAYQDLVKKKRVKPNQLVEDLFKKAGIRSTSGIAVITSLVKPYTCPGKCVYCPTEVRMPKSYIASEPAAARSLRLNFDPYKLMEGRILMLENNGHPVDKIEYITKGGTWNAYPLRYQYWYILESFKACNNLTRRKPVPPTQEEDWNDKPLTELQDALEQEQRYNEGAKHRIIGITLETRPDAISPKTIYHMRRQGCTRIELGLQAPDDRILELIQRGHTVKQFTDAMHMLRQAGFKVDLHFMPDLPGTTPEHDVEMYREIFDNEALRPDMIKIYPNTVIESAELYKWWQEGRYKPYGEQALFDALLEIIQITPRYCRVSRLIRDIPANEIYAGNTITNLREDLEKALHAQGKRQQCIRSREISRQRHNIPKDTVPQLFVDEYRTDGGTEYFISLEDPNRIALFGFCRLRVPDTDDRNERVEQMMPELKGTAFVRELHVYGQLVKIGKTRDRASQHRGFGKKLMAAAEAIVKDKSSYNKVAVISGVGVRGYYRKLGYRKVGTYMVKTLDQAT